MSKRKFPKRLLSLVLTLTLVATAIPFASVSAQDTSVNVPFTSSTSFTLPDGTSATSSSYRIPAMVNVNGTLVAASDIRWNTNYDGGGLDTLTARSTDGGSSWSYTVANYLGDNGNTYNGQSTAFIDPSLVVNGSTVYMLVDLYPYGVALNGSGNTSPSTSKGFDDNGNLLLSTDSGSTYKFYLNLSDYYIYTSDGTKTNLKTDAYFNLSYTEDELNTALAMATSTASDELEDEDSEVSADEATPAPEVTAEPTIEPTAEPTAEPVVTEEPSSDDIISDETTDTNDDTYIEESTSDEELTEESTEEIAPAEETTEDTGDSNEIAVEPQPTEEPIVIEDSEESVDNNAAAPIDETSEASEESDNGENDIATIADDTTSTNLFYSDSPFKVVRTGYLYLTSSSDCGATWSEPQLINAKNSGEQVLLVGPGTGITTSSGTMVFPVYSYSNGTQCMGFLYSSDGTNWTRVDSSLSSNPWSSESAVVELSNGNLRFFFRNGSCKLCYVDYSFSSGWSSYVDTGVYTNSNTEISAISYSENDSDGNQQILVSCPIGSGSTGSNSSAASARTNGRIFTFSCASDGTTTLKNTYSVNTSTFIYSSLCERSDGSVALLYENSSSTVTGMDLTAYTADELGLTSDTDSGDTDGGDTDTDTDDSDVAVSFDADGVTFTKTEATRIDDYKVDLDYVTDVIAWDVSLETASGAYTDSAKVTVTLPSSWDEKKTFGFVEDEDGTVKLLTGTGLGTNSFSFVSPHFSTVGVVQVDNLEDVETVTTTLKVGQTLAPETISKDLISTEGAYTTNDGVASFEIKHNEGSTETITEFKGYSSTTEIESGATYLLTLSSGAYAVTNTTSTSGGWTVEHLVINSASTSSDEPLDSKYEWTITETDGGYYVQDAEGKYMTIQSVSSGTNGTVTLSDTPAIIDITANGSGYIFRAHGTQCALDLAGAGTYGYTTALSYYGSTTTWGLYKKNITTTEVTTERGTTISFTGLKPGETEVTIGSTCYDVVVSPVEETFDFTMFADSAMTLDAVSALGLSSDNYTATYELTSGSDIVTFDSNQVKSGETSGTAVITATVTDKDGTYVGKATYTIVVTNVEITDTQNLYVPMGNTVKIEGLSGDVVLAPLDTTIATVDQTDGTTLSNGSLTVTGNTTDEGTTSVVVGNTLFNIHVVPKSTNSSDSSISCLWYIKITEMTETDVYYSVNASTLYQVEGTGVLIPSQTINGALQISFFAAPHEGYALSTMGSTNSAGEYLAFNWDDDISDCAAWPYDSSGTMDSYAPYANGINAGCFTKAQLKTLFESAKALGCDGTLVFTRGYSANVSSDLSFISEKIPDLKKEIVGFKRGTDSTDYGWDDSSRSMVTVDGYTDYYTYDSDCQFLFGDTLLYKLTVTTYSTNVNYTEAKLTDSKLNYTVSYDDNALDTANQTLTYYVTYTLTENDAAQYLGGKFTNEAELDFTYSSKYSKGTHDTAETADATAAVVGIISYVWADDTPEGIKNDTTNYPLPSTYSQLYNTTYSIKDYTGKKTYTADDGTQYVFVESWDVEKKDGGNETIPITDEGKAKTYTLKIKESVVMTGHWEEATKYNVTYKWDDDSEVPASAILPNTNSYYEGATYTVDNSYQTINDHEFTWTFSGWKKNGEGDKVDGTTQTVGTEDVTYVGSWTKTYNYTSLTLTKNVSGGQYDENEEFAFKITCSGSSNPNLIVTLKAGESITISRLLIDKEYTIEELTDWSWRYDADATSKSIKLDRDSSKNTVDFTNTLSEKKWLSGDGSADNRWDSSGKVTKH